MKKMYLTAVLSLMAVLLCSVTSFAQQEICEGAVEDYDVANTPGNTYDWQVTGTGFSGSLTGDGTHAIQIDWGTTPPGTYTLTVKETNAGNCSGTPVSLTIIVNPTPDTPTANLTQPTCTDPNGSITITAPTGSGMQYSIDGGNTYQASSTFTGLAPGTYDLVAQNDSGCISEATQVVIDPIPTAPSAPIVNVDQPVDCADAGGDLTITGPTGTGYTYSIDGGATFSSAMIYTDLPAGTYDVIVKSAEGCESTIETVTIDEVPELADPVADVYQPDCGETVGSIEITSPLNPDYEYSIDNGATYQSSETFNNLAPGSYTVIVRDTNGGCESATLTVTINSAPAAPTTSPINFN